MAARVEALASQINPHFLFNTLTSISSLIRSQPETARTLIVKLSGLLRRLLRSQEHFVTLREELEAIDEYLDIESIRFGPKLHIEKSIAPGQPRRRGAEHAAAAAGRELDQTRARRRKSARGGLRFAAAGENGHAIIDVIDNGVGVAADHANSRQDRRHRPSQRQRAPARDLRGELSAPARQRSRRGHLRADRDSRTGRAGEDHRVTADISRSAPLSSTTSSWRAKSCASCSGNSTISRSWARPANGIEALRAVDEQYA